jgi:hypothetical protein
MRPCQRNSAPHSRWPPVACSRARRIRPSRLELTGREERQLFVSRGVAQRSVGLGGRSPWQTLGIDAMSDFRVRYHSAEGRLGDPRSAGSGRSVAWPRTSARKRAIRGRRARPGSAGSRRSRAQAAAPRTCRSGAGSATMSMSFGARVRSPRRSKCCDGHCCPSGDETALRGP